MRPPSLRPPAPPARILPRQATAANGFDTLGSLLFPQVEGEEGEAAADKESPDDGDEVEEDGGSGEG